MTDQPDKHPHDGDLPTGPTESTTTAPAADPAAFSNEPQPTRWNSGRPRGRLGQIAVILVATASAVFIVGAIFLAGFVVGSEGGDEHHGHGGDGYSQNEGDDHRGGEAADGSGNGTAGDKSEVETSDGGGGEP